MGKKKAPNVGFKDVDKMTGGKLSEQGTQFDYKWARGKNNVFKKSGVEV